MIRKYYGYDIYHEHNHYVVVAPDGSEWTEDTVTDAYKAIDEELKLNKVDKHSVFK